MTADTFISNLGELITYLDTGLGKQLAKVGNDMVANIELRVTTTGESFDGSKFTPYSKTQLPPFFFMGAATRLKKGLNELEQMQKVNDSSLRKTKPLKGDYKTFSTPNKKVKLAEKTLSYAQFRNLIGMQSNFKTFELSGEMWKMFKVTNISDDFVKMGFTNPDAKDKATWNSNREGKNIILPSKEEIEFANEQMDKWLDEAWKKIMI